MGEGSIVQASTDPVVNCSDSLDLEYNQRMAQQWHREEVMRVLSTIEGLVLQPLQDQTDFKVRTFFWLNHRCYIACRFASMCHLKHLV